MKYELERLGKSLWSSLAGGEGIGMKFTGPGVVYTQSKNFNDFIVQIRREYSQPSPVAQAAAPVAAATATGIWSLFSRGGKQDSHGTKRKPRRAQHP